MVQFRSIAPDRAIPLAEFIDHHVNLGLVPFDRVEVPPAISDLATKVYYQSIRSWPFHLRVALNISERYHSRAVQEETREVTSGDFIAKLASLSHDDETRDTLSSLAQTLYYIVGFVINRPRTGMEFLLRGQRRIITPGNFWSGRPHIYLIDFEGQKATAKENVQAYGTQFGWIHARLSSEDSELGLRYLPKDTRHFDDYSAFISQSASLWVWSNEGKRRQEGWMDANRGHLIYEQQSVIELLEYGYMLHRALLAKTEAATSAKEVLVLRWAINHLHSQMADVSNFGEIRDLLHAGWKELGVDVLQSLISEGLSIKQAQTSLREARYNERVGRWLTIVFGVVAIPTLANAVLRPLWALFEWWHPSNESAGDLFFIGIAFVFVIIAIVLLSRIGRSLRK